MAKSETKNRGYLTGREIKAIAKANAKEMKRLEAYKNRRCEESEFLAQMRDDSNILEIEDLHTFFFTEQGVVKAVNGVSYDVPKNAVVGVVGESGCGKSVTSMSVMRLIQGPTGQIVEGSIRFKSHEYKRDEKGNPIADGNGGFEMEDKIYDIAKMPIHEIHRIRGKQIAMIFQEPMTSLNPVFTIGEQLDEVTFIHTPAATKEQAKAKSEDMLRLVGIIPENVYGAFPHELSGGMRQRVMIAMALAAEPRLIIADEPTTALDVTIQAQILDLLQDIKNKIDGSILLITHDLGVIAEMADYVVVMYAGKVIEKGTVYEIFQDHRTDGAYCGISLIADKAAHHPCVHHIVHLLENIARQQRQRKQKNMAGDITRGHIHIPASLRHTGTQHFRIHSQPFPYQVIIRL